MKSKKKKATIEGIVEFGTHGRIFSVSNTRPIDEDDE